MLERMRRGYTREAYDELVEHIRDVIPHASLSTDMIVGFCGETEEDHQVSDRTPCHGMMIVTWQLLCPVRPVGWHLCITAMLYMTDMDI